MMDHPVVEKLLQIEVVADEMLDEMPRTACPGIRSIRQPILRNRTDYLAEKAALLGEKTLKKSWGAHDVLQARINRGWDEAKCTEAHRCDEREAHKPRSSL